MPSKLPLPPNLRGLRYFVIRFDRDAETYDLLLPDRGESYKLGGAEAARTYLESAAGEYLGGRAHDAATSFGASQTLLAENRAFGLDLTTGAAGRMLGFAKADAELTRDRLMGSTSDDEVILL